MTRLVRFLRTRLTPFGRPRIWLVFASVLLMSVALGLNVAWAADAASLRGTVVDPLGGRVGGADVTLLRDGARVAETTCNDRGEFAFDGLAEGRYRLEVTAPGFEARLTDPTFVGRAARAATEVSLHIGPLAQYVSVAASAAETPLAKTGAPVAVIDAATLAALGASDVLDALRLVPGAHVVQTGQRGGPTSMFVRGGNSDFNKVIIDGVVANDIGGAFDFGALVLTGVDQVEVLRQSNSVVYGSDALAGVVSITTHRGRTRVPEATYSLDGGNLGTVSTSFGLGGTSGRFDYFSQYTHSDTDNSTPNSRYRNGTYAGRFSAALGHATDLSGTLRRVGAKAGRPSTTDFYGIADDASQDTTSALGGLALQSQLTDRWQQTIRFGASAQTSRYVNPAPTGEPFDPFGFGANYLGKTVTIRGADGDSVSGQAILDFGGAYPSVFETRTTRRAVSAQTRFQATADLDVSAGTRFEREAAYDDPRKDASATRSNGGVFLEARGALWHRHHISAGVGYEHNAAFKSAVTPRVSVASYLRQPSSSKRGDTKAVFNAGTGVKAPSVFQEQNSLFALLASVSGAAVSPIGPERSRNIDVGLEQGLFGGQARVRVSYFNNEFSDLIEYVSKSALPQVGVPVVLAASTAYGAYVNSQSFRASGVETSADVAMAWGLHASASYTHLDAVVTKSLSSSALAPAVNPAFPTIEIGAFSPLVGARPFRRPANSGTFMVSFARGSAQVALAGLFMGKRDDSTFLSDGFFGNSLLLPNRDLDAAYQKMDLSGSYRIRPRLQARGVVENLLDQRYAAIIGAPSLPRTVRIGITILLGGDR